MTFSFCIHVLFILFQGLSYVQKIDVDPMTGDIWRSHCDCASGRGPYATCKHLVAVFEVLSHFAKSGSLNVQLTCTEQIQQFKKPNKVYKGSPVKANDLGLHLTNDEDPRPSKFRGWEGYQSHVQNTTINFCSQTGLDISMRYAIPQANMRMLNNDHDYLSQPLIEV